MFIALPNGINLEIELIETKKTADALKLYHLWAEMPIDKKLLERIITEGVRALCQGDMECLAEEHAGGVYSEN
jgi:hypothetical protein